MHLKSCVDKILCRRHLKHHLVRDIDRQIDKKIFSNK